jgi:ElaB/YqjD/DUF883 family membrane-anchored ribosome-binding protein
MGNYSNKTCYDCGVKQPANQMERVTESYNSGRSDNTVTAGNVAWAAFSDTAAKKVKRTIVANNRRSYTRNRTVWKCFDCSGENKERRADVAKNISKAMKAVKSARLGGIFSKKKVISPEIESKLETLKKMRGETSRSKSKELRLEIESMLKDAPINWGDPSPEVVAMSKAAVVDSAEAVEAEEKAKVARVEAEEKAKVARDDALAKAEVARVVAEEKAEVARVEAEERVARAKAKVIEAAGDKEAKGLQPLAWYYKICCWIGILYGSIFSLFLFAPPEDAETGHLVMVSVMCAAFLYPSIKALYFRPYNTEVRKAKKS